MNGGFRWKEGLWGSDLAIINKFTSIDIKIKKKLSGSYFRLQFVQIVDLLKTCYMYNVTMF